MDPESEEQQHRLRLVLLALVGFVVLVAAGYGYIRITGDRVVHGKLVDASEKKPVAGAFIESESQTVESNQYGEYTIAGLKRHSILKIGAEGYRDLWVPVNDGGQIESEMHPIVLDGAVVNANGNTPLAGIEVTLGAETATTGPDGRYRLLRARKGAKLVVAVPGFERSEQEYQGQGSIVIQIKPVVVGGTVRDGQTNSPLRGAAVTWNEGRTETDAQGKYQVAVIVEGTALSFEAPGYLGTQAKFDGPGTLNVVLKPRIVKGQVKDNEGKPFAGASVTFGESSTTTDSEGAFEFRAVPDADTLRISADNFFDQVFQTPLPASVEVALRPNIVKGTIVDAATRKPISNATITFGPDKLPADSRGFFRLTDLESDSEVTVQAPGYEEATFKINRRSNVEVALTQRPKPKAQTVRALYLTHYGVGDKQLRGNVLDLIRDTEANAVVIDVKGDRGWLSYKSLVPLADEIGAQKDITIPDLGQLLAELKRNNVYTIARVVVFRDNTLARARPELAVRDGRTSGLFVDGEGMAWVDPFIEEVWDYNIAIAKEVASKGFDEVQFDYACFPTDPAGTTGSPDGKMAFSRQNTESGRVRAINGFLKKARTALKPSGTAVGVDVSGYVVWRNDDMGIGQSLEQMAEYADYISPMLYPSTFSDGLPRSPSYTPAVSYPYETVYYSLEKALKRVEHLPVIVRPWIQYFDDYPWATGKRFGEKEMQQQKKAAYDNDLTSWMMWDPTSKYDKGGID